MMIKPPFTTNSNCEELLLPENSQNEGVKLYIKRDDTIGGDISGNKWRKLKHNLLYAKEQGYNTLLTFGGAFSNHIYATAAAGKIFGFNTIGVIRGEEVENISPTLRYAIASGMKLHYCSRTQFRDKYAPDYLKQLQGLYGDFYLLPEGGTNELALKGVGELVNEITIDYDVLCCPIGTGGTMSGLICAENKNHFVLGFASLNAETYLTDEVTRLTDNRYNNWKINHDYHFGAYAKMTKELAEFIQWFEQQYEIALDPIYTAKMMFGIFDMIRNKDFKPNTRIVALHTGGLQGREGMKDKIEALLNKKTDR